MKARLTLSIVFIVLLFSTLIVQGQDDTALDFDQYELDNGLQVILVEDHSAPTVAVDIWYDVGSAQDPSQRSGLAVTAEQLCRWMESHAMTNLTPEQAREMARKHLQDRLRAMDQPRRHQELGAQLVAPLGYPPAVSEAILHHHDRWDGEGLPSGPEGEGIPLLSRILAVADEFDRLTHDHPYRAALTTAEAVQQLRKQAGSALDPQIVRVLVSLAELGLCSVGPLGDLPFEPGEDPVDSIAQATAWLEMDR